MNSRTQVPGLHTRASSPRRRALRSAQALAFLLTALVGAASCVDGSRLSGPFKPIGGEQVVGLNLAYDSVAPSAIKSAPRLRSLGAASGGSLLSPRGTRALTSLASDPVTLQVTPIEFKAEGGPFENLIPSCDDCLFGKADGTGFDIGFDFTFFGNTYKEFWISTNGFISFEPVDNGCCEGNPIPFADDQINNIIALLWSDLTVERGQVGFETRGSAPNRRLVVDFSNVVSYDAPDHLVSAQLILYEGTNAIEMHTASLPTPTTYRYTQGIENALGSDAAFVPGRVNALFGLSNDAIRFAPPGGNRAPSVSAGGNAGGPPADRYEGREGAAIAFKAVGSDIDNDELSYSWDFDGNGVADAQGAEASHAYADNGIYTARVTASDPHGLSATASVEVRVENVAPSAELKAADVDEGSPIVLSVGDVVDPSSVDQQSGFEFAFDCGDGFGTYSAVASVSCATVDNERRTVRMKVRDRDGGESLSTKAVEVRNVAPAVETAATVTAKSGQLVSLDGRFSDAGVRDWLWKWSWNPPTQGIAVENRQPRSGGSSSQQGAVSGEYRACGVGPQKVTLVVEDKDGARGEATVTVMVEAQPVDMRVKPSIIALNARDRDEDSDSDDQDRYSDDHGRLVTVYLFSNATFDATAIDPASVRLTNGTGKGTPLAVKRNRRKGTEWDIKAAHLNADRLRDMKLRFSRRALIANGDLTASTTSLSLVANATCAGAIATGPVAVR